MYYLETLSAKQLWSFTTLCDSLGDRVFGFRDEGGSYPAHPRPGGRGAEVWVGAHSAKLGIEPFWKTWWAERDRTGDGQSALQHLVETSWNSLSPKLRKSERQGIETLDSQISRIRSTSRRKWKAEYGHLLQTAPRPPHPTDNPQIQQYHEEGTAEPEAVFASVPFQQPLDWETFQFQPKTPPPPAEDSRLRRRVACCGPPRGSGPRVAREYRELYNEWEVEWEVEWKRREGWRVQVKMMGVAG
jgi:hypothetical protein